MTRGQILAELARRGDLPAKFQAEYEKIKASGDQQFLATLPSERAALVQAIAEGRMKPPTASRSGGAQLLADVAAYKPGFNAADAASQQAARVDLARGDLGRNIRSLNTAIGHLGSLADNVDALGNTTSRIALTQVENAIKNRLAIGNGAIPQRQFGENRKAVADELETAFRGGRGGTLAGTKGWEENLNINDSPGQQRAAIQTAAHLLQARIDAIGDQYGQAMRTTADGISLLAPDAQAAMKRFSNPNFLSGKQAIGGPTIPPNLGGRGTGGYDGPPPAAGGPNTPPPSGGMPGGIINPTAPGADNSNTARTIATGDTHTVDDPDVAAKIEALIKAGASADVINTAISDRRTQVKQEDVTRAQAYLKQHPDYSGFVSATHDEPTTAIQRFAASPIGALAAGAGDAILPAGLFGQDFKDKVRAVEDAHPNYALAGTVIGGIPAATSLELGAGRLLPQGAAAWAPRVADAAYGAYEGFGNADKGQGASGALIGGIGGLGLGMAGRQAARATGSAVRGVTNDAVQYLRDQNIPLTVGQTVGGVVKGVEDRLSGLPVVGDIVRSRRQEGVQAFDRAAFDQGLAPLENIRGFTGDASTGGEIGERGVNIARDLRSQGYSAALDGVRVSADAPYVADTQRTLEAGQALPDPMRGRMGYTLLNRAGQAFDDDGNLTGHDFQQAIRGLRRDAKAVQSEPYGHDFGNVTGQAESDLEGLLNRQAPGVVDDYGTANTVNRNVEILRDAVNNGRNGARTGMPGAFAPSQLADAAAANARKFGGTHGTTDQPFYDLTRAGQEVLPSSVPDSGTTGRYALLAIPGALSAAGGGAGYATGEGTREGSEVGLGTGALLALAGSRGAQRGLVSLLADRPDLLRRVGTSIYDNAGYAGIPLVAGSSQIPALTAPR